MSTAIATLGLTRRFGSIAAVNGIDLNVPENSVYGFLGPNGAGKTTTIRMLLGLLRPTQGEIHLFDLSLKENRPAILSKTGSLVETPSLYSHLTGFENLEVLQRLLNIDKSHIARVLSVVRLEQDARRPVKQYSLGMKQRLGLAAALLGEPRLLILDEPTNGLDPAGILEMRKLLQKMPEEHGITVFLSSHLLSEVEQMATHIGILNAGSMIFQGPLKELQSRRHEHLYLETDNPRTAMSLLAGREWLCHPDGSSGLKVEIRKREETADINKLMVQNNIRVFQLSLIQSSLEDIFLTLTNSDGEKPS